MTSIQLIPLNKLIPSPANVRRTGAALNIEELAASIAAHGLLQNLQVRPAARGKFEVVAGGRRLAALKLLVKQGKLDKSAEIPCHVLGDEDAGEISLAENIMRVPMHPADQFDAFKAMIDQGKGIEDTAARFGTSAAVVRQRLKLASVSPTLIELYRADEMSLDQLMAFTVSDDHEVQEAAWFTQPKWNRDPSSIRHNLTSAHREADDDHVRFVGLDTYQAAGGGIIRDLFQPEHQGYLTDPALLDRLVAAKLEAEAEAIRAGGWAWVEAIPTLEYGALQNLQRIHPEAVPLSDEEQEELDRLSADYDAVIEEHGDDCEGEPAARLETLSEQIDANLRMEWRDGDKSFAGVIVTIGHGGKLQIERGLIRSEDVKSYRAAQGDTANRGAGAKATGGLSAVLIEDLTAHRTMALRALLADSPMIALATVAHALALPVFYGSESDAASCLSIKMDSRNLAASADGIEDKPAAILIEARFKHWQTCLPKEPAALFGWLLAQDAETVMRLLGFCAAQSIDAVQGKQDRGECSRLTHGGELADALDLDMTMWWRATKESYFGRVSKALILEAVTEGVSAYAARDLASFKKDALAMNAEQRLAGKNWLPAILRSPVEAEVLPDIELPAAA